jgi:hypothetical protein
VVMISDAGTRSPMTAFLYVYVNDTDATYRKLRLVIWLINHHSY